MLDQRFFANIDWVLCFLVLLICGVGLIALSSATVGTPGQEDYLIQQVFRILAGIGVIILVQLVHYRNWARLGFVMHLVVIGLLVLVLLYGTGGPGAPVQRWLKVGPFFSNLLSSANLRWCWHFHIISGTSNSLKETGFG